MLSNANLSIGSLYKIPPTSLPFLSFDVIEDRACCGQHSYLAYPSIVATSVCKLLKLIKAIQIVTLLSFTFIILRLYL